MILNSEPPTEDVEIFMRNSQYGSKLLYLAGNALNFEDLARASIETSKCAIILANKFTQTPQYEDNRNILTSFAIKSFVREIYSRDIRVCLQLLKPESKELFYSISNPGLNDQVICVDEFKLYLLSKTSLCPGIITIISTLITSEKPNYPYDESVHPSTTKKWVDEYLWGVQNEMYRIPLDSTKFAGLSFSVVSQQIYKHFDIILFALEITIENETRVYCNPSEYIFQEKSHYGYVIASRLPIIEDFQNFSFPNVQRTFNLIPKTTKKKNKNTLEFILEKRLNDYKGDRSIISKSFYYQKVTSLEAATIKNKDDNFKFENHIIVCGLVDDMRSFLLALRAKSLKTVHPVIILHNELIPVKIWKEINRFPKIYYLQGSPLKRGDLDRAGIDKAIAAIILSSSKEGDKNSFMVDADTIFIYKTIKTSNPGVRIITELASFSTINFLIKNKSNTINKFGFRASEPFASGEIYI